MVAPRRILLPEPQARQLEVLRHPARNKCVVCGRRWGKTIAGLIACVEGHGPKGSGFRGALDGGTIWWIAPSFPIANLIWMDLKRALRDAWIEKKEKELRIVLPGGGSVTVKSADNPDSLRGVGLDGVVLDEAAFMAEAAWVNGIRPALADRQGWALFLSTPDGMNWFARLFETAGEDPAWARWQRPTSENTEIPDEEIAALRRDMGEVSFAQEHLAEFITGGAGLFKPRWLEHRYEVMGETYRLPDGTIVGASDLRLFATVDLAVSTKTTADYSVMIVFGITPENVLLVLEVRRVRLEGPDLTPWMKEAHVRWKLPSIWVEKSGFQLAIVQEASRAGLPVRELRPDRDKFSRALPATAAMESGRLLLPQVATWCRDFESELLAFPKGRHDDQVDALAYGVLVLHDGFGSSTAYTSSLRKIRRKSPRVFTLPSPSSRKGRNPKRRRIGRGPW